MKQPCNRIHIKHAIYNEYNTDVIPITICIINTVTKSYFLKTRHNKIGKEVTNHTTTIP